MELFLQAGQNYSFLIELITKYLKLEERGQVKLIYLSQGSLKAVQNKQLALAVPSLVTKEGTVETQIFMICKRLFEIQPQWKLFFLGEGAEVAQISDIKVHLKEGKQLRKHLQKHLESRTFFVSNHLTFADLFMFTQLHENILEMTDEQKGQYNNLFRWYKHIQNLPQIKEYLTKNSLFLVVDPVQKYPFLAEKKKGRKEKEKDAKKEQAKKDVKKEQAKKEEETKTESEVSTEKVPA